MIPTWANDLAGQNVNAQPSLVKMLDVYLTASQSGQKVNLGLVEEVVVFPLKTRMRFLLYLELHIAGLETRCLVSLASEIDLMTVLHPLVDRYEQYLAFDSCLFTAAFLATILLSYHLTLTLAVWANSLETLDHGTHLSHHSLHTGTVTARAGLDSSLFASTPITCRTYNGLL